VPVRETAAARGSTWRRVWSSPLPRCNCTHSGTNGASAGLRRPPRATAPTRPPPGRNRSRIRLVLRNGRRCSNQAGSRPLAPSGLPRVVIAQGTQGAIVIGPAGLDLHPQIEHDAALDQVFDIAAGLGADALDALAVLADENFFLPAALPSHGG